MDKKLFFSEGSDLFLFKDKSLMVVAAIVSLLLQVISFFTTLDGAKAYFAATFAYAPLLFALAVQTVVYFLANGIRRRISSGKVVALLLAVCCSSYFSFVGIYNNVNPPSQYLERTYNGYVKELTALRDGMLEQCGDEYALAVDRSVNSIISEYTLLVTELETLNALEEELASSENEFVYGMAEPYIWQYESYEQYAAAYELYISSLSQSSNTEQQAKLQAVLNRYGFSDTSQISERKAELTASISLAEGTLAAFGGADTYSSLEVARAAAKGGDEASAETIAALHGSLCGKEPNMPQYVSDERMQLELPPYAEVAGNSAAAVVRERLSSIVAAAADTLSAAGIEVDAAEYTFMNIYTLPMYSVMSGDFGADAVVCLVLAVLVDMMSLLFAMIFVQSRSVLAAKDTRQAIMSDPMLFQRNIVVAVQVGMIADGVAFSEEPDLDAVTDRLGEFVSRFSAVDAAADKGYTMAAARADLNGFEQLVSFLCQFGLAKLLSAEEMSLLCGKETEETVLLKTKFLLWLSERCRPEVRKPRASSERAVRA
ncbi:MAG: hypothetical protein E7478_10095 [Ruminococcaceae bacterium]|nr:hypothetical protein [Oscillospiraceae bacterium]